LKSSKPDASVLVHVTAMISKSAQLYQIKITGFLSHHPIRESLGLPR